MYDPVKLAIETERIVSKGHYRKYYREVRTGRWYGGIASADCCGCCLRCIFCWSGIPRDHPSTAGHLYSAGHVFKSLVDCAEKCGYTKLRVSGNEPTIGREHLLRLLELVESTKYFFILETNGILLGHDYQYVKSLAGFKRLYVRVSLKGTGEKEFSLLTGAKPEAFSLQLKALENLLNAGVSSHPAVMASFSTQSGLARLKRRLRDIDPQLPDQLEEERVILYPITLARLKSAGVKPFSACTPDGHPERTYLATRP